MEEQRTQFAPFRAHLRYLPQIRGEDADLILEFFMVYSRFEFSLKKVGFRNNDRGYLMPDWKAFSLTIQDRFNVLKSPELLHAYNYYLSKPPKIETLTNDRLDWKENRKRDDQSEFVWVTLSIGIVRNNLFHGGKFPWDQVRDTELLSYGLIILYDCLELNEEVFRAFNYSP